MPAHKKYPPELKERAVHMLLEWREARGRGDGGVIEVAGQLGVHPDTVRSWLSRHQIDSGEKPGLTTDERARIKHLERENFELRRANEILKSASAFFAAELDRQPKK